MTQANGVPRRERKMGVRVVGMKVAGLISLACAATILAGCAGIMDFVLPPKFSPEGQIWIDGLEADAKGDFADSVAKFSALANAGDPYVPVDWPRPRLGLFFNAKLTGPLQKDRSQGFCPDTRLG